MLFTNRTFLLSNLCVINNLPSTDHDAIHFTLCSTVSPESPCKRALYKHKADMTTFLETLSHVPWHIIESGSVMAIVFRPIFLVVDMMIPHVK